jgi:FtsP/CotA-like multicopper oxidase with cupredoxin domain
MAFNESNLPRPKNLSRSNCRPALHPNEWRFPILTNSCFQIAVAIVSFIVLQAVPARAQAPTPGPTPVNPCPTQLMPGQALIPVPVIGSSDGRLRGTLILSDEQEWMTVRVPASAPTSASRSQCLPQFVRTFREYGAKSTMAAAPYGPYARGTYALPRPGPTLRARVGDLVQLTFINQINPADFGDSIDRGETGRGGGCDESSGGYPGSDKFPDCFHGSSTGNLHFHGTHTNPNATADNVFIEVRPSLREKGKPVVTPESVASSFDKFFAKCEVELSRSLLKEWPTTWNDLPGDWTDQQKKLLKEYDTQLEKNYGPGVRKLWPINEAQIKQGAWPQYYVGAFPFCYRLPEYKALTWPPAPPAAMKMGGAGTAEVQMDADDRPLIMGQSPGTHWYHAHKHGSTAINVANGMTGAFIIEGQYDDDLNKWYGDGWTRTQPVLVINQLGVSPNLMRKPASGGGPGPGSQDKGPDFSIDGQIKPVIQMQPGEVQMWRIVNTSGRAGVYFTGPPTGFEWKQLAQDGVQFNDANYQSHRNKPFLLAAGNRADILVKAPAAICAIAGGCASPVIVKNEVDPQDLTSASPLTLLSVNIAGQPLDPKSNAGNFIPKAPYFPPFLKDIAREEVTGTKTLVFAAGAPGGTPTPAQQTIDGKKFDGEVGAVVLLNKVEEWKIMNATYAAPISHPFHIHINPFQIVEVFDPNEILTGKNGKPVIDPVSKQPVNKYVFQGGIRLLPGQCYLDPFAAPENWKPCGPEPVNKNGVWWDVFPIPSGRTVTTVKMDPNTKKPVTVNVPGYFKMRSRFVDYSGFYVLHCHILAHEDRGMMTIVEVTPVRTPYSHH